MGQSREERDKVLANGNKLRLRRAELFRKLRTRTLPIAKALDHPDMQGATLARFGQNIPIRGRGMSGRRGRSPDALGRSVMIAYRTAGIAPAAWTSRRIGNLTGRQKEILAVMLDTTKPLDERRNLANGG